ncbi:GFA family protein [Lichenifustis flavocetrariae]|uniref:GFA family protein n=1 Tax=Lichenifustis flavocetrariae TaxID=2949735 RepID=A0AA41YZ41_9HYPH|nr:GFA family protein [Lichenifustis flavocetrariae]MCW6509945.1 GFA family protein [Lichenifustis flavocetrariae]
MSLKIEGGCLCGACRYETHAAPMNVRACHCHRCQKATGASFYARVMVPLDSVIMRGPLGWFGAENGVRRGFCTLCGTSLASERQSANTIGLAMGSLDQPDRFEPTEHIWTSSKQAWLKLDDGRSQYPEGPPA